jgi:hypothetical protein
VIVVDDPMPVITTDVSNVAETKIGEELVELPVAIYSRSSGSTSLSAVSGAPDAQQWVASCSDRVASDTAT